jgi:hypothetical protein
MIETNIFIFKENIKLIFEKSVDDYFNVIKEKNEIENMLKYGLEKTIDVIQENVEGENFKSNPSSVCSSKNLSKSENSSHMSKINISSSFEKSKMSEKKYDLCSSVILENYKKYDENSLNEVKKINKSFTCKENQVLHERSTSKIKLGDYIPKKKNGSLELKKLKKKKKIKIVKPKVVKNLKTNREFKFNKTNIFNSSLKRSSYKNNSISTFNKDNYKKPIKSSRILSQDKILKSENVGSKLTSNKLKNNNKLPFEISLIKNYVT